MKLLELLIIFIVSGEVSVLVTGMPHPEMPTESTRAVAETFNEESRDPAIDIVEQIAQGNVPMENVADGQEIVRIEKVADAQENVRMERVADAQVDVPMEKVAVDQGNVPMEKVADSQVDVPMEKVADSQVDVPKEKVADSQVDVPMEKVADAQEGVPIDKAPITQRPLPAEPAPVSQEVLPKEEVPVVEEVVSVNKVPIAEGEFLEKVPSSQTVEQGSKLQNMQSMDNAPALEEPVVPTNPSMERLAKLLSFKSMDTAHAVQVMESVDKVPSAQSVETLASVPSVQTVETVANVPSPESADKAPTLSVSEPVDQFPVSQVMEPEDTSHNVPNMEAVFQGIAPAEVPSSEVGRLEHWDSAEEDREAANQLAYQQFLGIDPLTFAINENNFDDEGENDRHYVKKRILQLSSEERQINQAYSENIEQREAERFRRKSLAIMRQSQK